MPSFGTSLNSTTPPISQSTPPSPPSQSNPNSEGSSFAKQNWTTAAHQPQLYLATLPTFTPAHDASSSKSLQLGVSRPKRKRISPEQLEVLSNLFEYTDTPTFDLREAIGSKLGMSNREVQVWFQNRRAKVNRQRIPSNSQVLQERTVASAIPQQQDPSPPSHRRMKSSPTHLLLPGVSSILNSDSCRGTYSAPPLLPPFQATLPSVDNLHDGPMYQVNPERYFSGTAPPSPQDHNSAESFFSSSSQARPGSPGTRRRIPISTPASLHSRKSPRCRSPVTSFEDSTRSLSARPSSADFSAGVTPDSSTPGLTTSKWNSAGSSHTQWTSMDPRSIPHSQTSYMSLGSMRLDQSSQHNLTPPQDWASSCNEHSNKPFEKQQFPHQRPLPRQSAGSMPIPSSRCSSASQPLSQWQSCGGSAPSPTTLPFSKQTESGGGVPRVENVESSKPSGAPQSQQDQPPPTTRSLFASRYLPPLPNPVRPGPGSFPPPRALRIIPTPKESSTTRISRSPHSASELTLPPLLNEQNES